MASSPSVNGSNRSEISSQFVALIAFTGSRAVGLAINARAAEVSAAGDVVKRVIAEMGGKNAILVDDDALVRYGVDDA